MLSTNLTDNKKIENECLKQEFILNLDNYGKVMSVNGLYSLARLIQTLFLIIPGSYPNHPDMGIGIQNYKFEFLDDITLNNIKQNAEDQIKRYIPNNLISDIEVQKLDDKNSKNVNSIGVLINLTENIDNTNNLIITFENLGQNGNIISDFYI